ncbi:MAG: DinB family protein [Vicingaceae bacterium]
MKELLITYLKYNVWANQSLAKRLENLSPSKLEQELESSFSSIQLTIEHIYDAEVIWLERIEGKSIDYWPSKKTGTLSLGEWVAQSETFLVRIMGANEQNLNTLCTYSNTKGEVFQQRVYELIMHVMNHSTFHRGQIVSMLRQLGEKEIPQTDLIKYLRIRS